jgi:hypothetical protein
MLKRLTMAVACVFGCAALTLDPAAAASDGGLLKGRTQQKRVIRLAHHGDRVQIKHFSIQLRCRDGSILIDTESGFLPTPLRGGGRIRDHQVGNTDDVWIKGRLRGRVLRGAIRVRDRVGRIRCSSKWVRFHAK